MTGATGVHLLLWSEDRQVWLLPSPSGNGGIVPVSGSGDDGLVPMSVLRYARRTDEPLVVSDATRDDRFARDPYFTDVACCSLLALPILSRGSVQALLVLENRLIRGAFSTQRLDAVKLIAGQLAVSLDNAQLCAEFRRIADEQAALRRVATLVAAGARPSTVFAAVADEVGRLLAVEGAFVVRYEPDETVTTVAASNATDKSVPVGLRRPVVQTSLSWLVRESGRPARIDYADDPVALEYGISSSVAAPITVEGRLWGYIAGSTTQDRPPPETEARLAGFTELVATAIANADSRAQLMASRARIVAAADGARRRIERDLHDGAQQRLASLVLRLRTAQADVPSELRELGAELDRAVADGSGALEELQEIARGIHPAILAKGGLGPALKTLARRSAVPVELDVRTTGRLPEPVEIAAYYVASEALANAAKHADAAAVTVTVEADAEDHVLRIAVWDDGVGGADFTRGTGLVGLRDRVEALGGRIVLDSTPGAGTRLRAELPIPATKDSVTSR